jgi:radical SAM superfamily enzyme YgiQ (UPF0313 family)
LGDSVIGGEYEGALVALADALDRGVPASEVDGVGTRDWTAAPILERRALAVPARASLPPLRGYAGLERESTVVRAGYVECTRGCHHTCRHCPITPVYAGRFFPVPREIVVADALAQIDAGAEHITFGDPDFFNGPRHGLRVMAAIHERHPAVTFDATIKIEHILEHRRLLPELAGLGCIFVVSAVESLSDLVLGKLAKGHAGSDVDQAIDLLDAVRVPMRPSLLPFTPWSTLQDYLQLLSWIARRDLESHVDPIQLSIRLLVPPGSALLADHTSRDWLGELDQARFTYRWCHPDPRMDELQRIVAATVERAASAGQSARATFAEIWAAAQAIAGVPATAVPSPVEQRAVPPRLTEDWFC